MAKDYGYIWILMARIFKLRADDDDSVTREVPMEADDPRLIAPTIAECEPLSPHEILATSKQLINVLDEKGLLTLVFILFLNHADDKICILLNNSLNFFLQIYICSTTFQGCLKQFEYVRN